MILDRANRNRQARFLIMDDLFRVHASLGELPGSYAWIDGTVGPIWNFHVPRTTLALFLRFGDGQILLGVEECPAYGALPGRAWWSSRSENLGRGPRWSERLAGLPMPSFGCR